MSASMPARAAAPEVMPEVMPKVMSEVMPEVMPGEARVATPAGQERGRSAGAVLVLVLVLHAALQLRLARWVTQESAGAQGTRPDAAGARAPKVAATEKVARKTSALGTNASEFYGFSTRGIQCDSDRILAAMRSKDCASASSPPICVAHCPDASRGLRVVVSHEHRFVYVDVHKSASTTVRALLSRIFGARVSYERALMRPPDLPPNRMEYKSVYLRSELFRQYFVFTFVREPKARFASGLAQVALDRNKTNANFLVDKTLASHALRELQRGETLNSHLKPQISQIVGSTLDGERVAYDFVGRVEYFYRDFMYIMAQLGRKPIPAVPQSNQMIAQLKHNSQPASNPAFSREGHVDLGIDDPDVTNAICTVYSADYHCFGYPLPAPCRQKKL